MAVPGTTINAGVITGFPATRGPQTAGPWPGPKGNGEGRKRVVRIRSLLYRHKRQDGFSSTKVSIDSSPVQHASAPSVQLSDTFYLHRTCLLGLIHPSPCLIKGTHFGASASAATRVLSEGHAVCNPRAETSVLRTLHRGRAWPDLSTSTSLWCTCATGVL